MQDLDQIKQYYQTSYCPFCKEHLSVKLDKRYEVIDRTCINKQCKSKYFVSPTQAAFELGNYSFVLELEDNSMRIKHYLPPWELYELPTLIIVNADNYLEIIERCKRLRVFI